MSLSQVSKEQLHAAGAAASNLESEDDDSVHSSSYVGKSSSSDGTGSQYGSTSDSNRTGSHTSDDDMLKNALAKEETKQVFRLRVLVILILIAAATCISVAIFHITRNAEMEEFELQYYAAADKIVDAMQEVMVKMAAVSGIAVAATAGSSASSTEESSGEATEEDNPSPWPFVTLSSFQERAQNAESLSGAIYVTLSPIVETGELADWERYVLSNASQWIDEGLEFQEKQDLNDFVDRDNVLKLRLTTSKVDPLHSFDAVGNPRLSTADGPFLPQWQTSPVLLTSNVNENLFENSKWSQTARDCIDSKSAVLGGFILAPPGPTNHPNPDTAFFATLLSIAEGRQMEYQGDPMANLFIPVFDTLTGGTREVVGVLKSTIHWLSYMSGILPTTNQGITLVVENACDGNYTYMLDGSDAQVVGFGDKHDTDFDEYHVRGRFFADTIDDGTLSGLSFNQDGCPYTFHVFPTKLSQNSHKTNDPLIISLSVAAVFVFTIGMFAFYDRLVERRQRLVLAQATQSTAIVSSLFPKQVRDRLLAMESDKRKGDALVAPSHKLKSFLTGMTPGSGENEQPIADFFPNCTVIFADMAGFTAWSSTREPAQVFLLLQTVYQNFDIIAKRRRVFKVETIGDSYLAVTGLPEPQMNHAIHMAKFAWDCLIRIGEIMKELEVSLGPDTGDLSMRFGLNSGSVTAGVLKGDRARFQLFGDTVNTAARMESTGMKGRIQVSESTAAILRTAGKESWLTRREDSVVAKGKGVLNTYWLVIKTGVRTTSSDASFNDIADASELLKPTEIETTKRLDMKQKRLVDWVVEILLEHMKKVVVVHQKCGNGAMANEDLRYSLRDGNICLDEVQDAINMPAFDAKVADAALDSRSVEVPYDIIEAVREYVGMIADAYRENPFHNFEHACHVTMSVNKLLSRVVTPDLNAPQHTDIRKGRDEVTWEIHRFTHGITSDPMAVLALVFSALIHDVDHQGVSNAQLVKEEPEMGAMYRNKSVAEQNSLDVAWDMLMSARFDRLRKYVFETRSELLRFRQLIVNMVLATDIFDQELGQLRKDRWQRAFHGNGKLSQTVVNDLRATIVMEHIIQASDVSHTMQHWHVYQKWNRKLFTEMYKAYKAGRMGGDPREFWYKGELSFFDNYVIPLAKKLKECNVFGVSSDEYLGYAERNRAEWEERGEDILQNLIKELVDESSSRSIGNARLETSTVAVSIGGNTASESESSNTH